MDLDELRLMTLRGEGLHQEFKRKLPEPQKLMREAIALTNTEGGWLFVGVDDDGTVVGLKDPDEAEESFKLYEERFIRPKLDYFLRRIPVSTKRTVVGVKIKESSQKPHVLVQKPSFTRGKAFYRVDDKSIVASTELFFILKNRSAEKDITFEYGEKEKALFEYLSHKKNISLGTFSRIADISRIDASKTLVTLTSANILKILPNDTGDIFVRKETPL